MIDVNSKNLKVEYLTELLNVRTIIQDAAFYSKQRLDVHMWTDCAIDKVNDLIEALPFLLNLNSNSND